MDILITGGTGLIGQALIPALLQKEHQVVLLTRNKKSVNSKFDTPMPHFKAVVEDLDQVNFNQIDAVINLAGEPIVNKRWSKKQKTILCESRWQLTSRIVEKIRQADKPPATLISGSAVGMYGRQNDQPIDESFQAFYPEFSHTLCAEWEKIAQGAASESTRVCLSRTGMVLSTKGGALSKMLPAFRLGLGGPIASGKQMMSWIHIDDMVRLLIFLLEHPTISGPVNATAPNPVSNEAFSKALAASLNRPCIFRVPKTVLKLAMGEMSDLLIYGQAVVPRKLMEAGFVFSYPQINHAFKALMRQH